MYNVVGGRVVAMLIENGRVVACGLVELRRVEVPAEVVGCIDVLLREVIEIWWRVEVLFVEERHFRGHLAGWVGEGCAMY